MARGHAIGAIGDGVGHVDDIDDSSALDGAVAIAARLLHGDRLILIESKGEMVGEVAAGDGDGLGLDLGVEVCQANLCAQGTHALPWTETTGGE